MGRYRCSFCSTTTKDTAGAPVAPHNCPGSGGVYGWVYESDGSGCLAEGARILTANGARPIEDIEPGDSVLGFDDLAMRLVPSTVIRTLRYTPRKILIVRHTRGELRCTGLHTIMTCTGGRRAHTLRPGDVLRFCGMNNGALVDSVIEQVVPAQDVCPVFNLRVTGSGTFVAEDLLVHSFTGLRALRQAWLNWSCQNPIPMSLPDGKTRLINMRELLSQTIRSSRRLAS